MTNAQSERIPSRLGWGRQLEVQEAVLRRALVDGSGVHGALPSVKGIGMEHGAFPSVNGCLYAVVIVALSRKPGSAKVRTRRR